jgi:hypothetical protein
MTDAGDIVGSFADVEFDADTGRLTAFVVGDRVNPLTRLGGHRALRRHHDGARWAVPRLRELRATRRASCRESAPAAPQEDQ